MLFPLNYEPHEFDELDELVLQHPLQDDRSRLLLALAGTLFIHLLILGFWKIDRSRIELFPTLKVFLQPTADKPAPVPDVVHNEVPEAVPETLRETSNLLTPPLDLSDEPKSNKIKPVVKRDGFSLYRRAIEIVREGSLAEVTSYKTFSTRDFPQAKKKIQFESKEYIPVMVSEAETMEHGDQQGYYTIKRTNGFGKSVCYQQRGFAGDGNPPLWYRVPASTCGHIK
jgi:hypothetical protein